MPTLWTVSWEKLHRLMAMRGVRSFASRRKPRAGARTQAYWMMKSLPFLCVPVTTQFLQNFGSQWDQEIPKTFSSVRVLLGCFRVLAVGGHKRWNVPQP